MKSIRQRRQEAVKRFEDNLAEYEAGRMPKGVKRGQGDFERKAATAKRNIENTLAKL